MPNRDVHCAAGLVAGGGAGLASAPSVPADHQALHTIFAAIGGVIGGIAPDFLEPATCPTHRKAFHSLAAGGGLIVAWASELRANCYARAADCDHRASVAVEGSDDRRANQLKAFFWRALAALIIGFLAGYASHLALDAGTRRGLPLLGI